MTSATTSPTNIWRSSTSSGKASWEDDAVVRDAARRIYARGDKVHKVTHEGPAFPHERRSSCPSRRRSARRCFTRPAGRRAAAPLPRGMPNASFSPGLPKEKTAERVRAIREQARAEGRDPSDLRFIMMATVIVAPTEAEARDKHEELARYVDVEGMLALYLGHDRVSTFRQHSPDDAARRSASRGIRTVIEGFTTANTRPRLAHAAISPISARRADANASSWARRPRSRTSSKAGWRDAEIDGFNLQRSGEPDHLARLHRPRRARIAESAASTSAPIARGRFAKNSSARATACPPIIGPRCTGLRLVSRKASAVPPKSLCRRRWCHAPQCVLRYSATAALRKASFLAPSGVSATQASTSGR